MKIAEIFVVLSLFFCLPVHATTYWVSPTGAAANLAACSGESPLSGTDCCTFDQARGAGVVGGDTVYYRAGDYTISTAPAIKPANSGTSGNIITFSAYSGEVVNFIGTVDNSDATAIDLEGKSYIHVTGVSDYNMTFTQMEMNIKLGYNTPGHYNEIDHCEFGTFLSGLAIGDVNYRGSTIQHGSQYNYIHDNSFHDWQIYSSESDGPVVLEVGEENGTDATSFNVIENNQFYHGGHHVVGLAGIYNVFRNNVVHNENYWNNAGTLYGYRNMQLSTGMSGSVGNHLVEGNRYGKSGISWLSAYLDGLEGRGTQRGGTSFYLNSSDNLVRYNDYFGALSMAINFRRYTGGEVKNNYVYNNTIYYSGYSTENDIECGERYPINLDYSENYIEYNVVKNTLYNSTWPQTTSDPQQPACGTRPLSPVIYGTLTTMTVANNLEATGSHFINTDISDAMSMTLPNLGLVSSSNAIDGGTYLTQANGAGTGSTSLVVDDARYFQDGKFGQGITWPSNITTMQADWIAIGTVTNVVQISSINYATNTITLASPKTWVDDASVWLYSKSDGARVLYGSAPDYGAHEFSAIGSLSTGGSNTLTIGGAGDKTLTISP